MTAIASKSILTRSRLPRVDYVINPYLGCTVGCKYCYARFMKRFSKHAKGPWGTFVHWKSNIVDVLSREVQRLKHRKDIILLSSVTDPYQAIERRLNITRAALDILLEQQLRVSVLTKCKLARRDFDLFTRFRDIEFGVSLSSLSRKVSKSIEPRASAPKERIQLLKSAHEKGIKTYAFISPLQPYITSLEPIFSQLKGNVDYIMAESINTRCGNWADLSQVLKSLHIDPAEYRQKSQSKRWISQQRKELESLSAELGVEFKGLFVH